MAEAVVRAEGVRKRYTTPAETVEVLTALDFTLAAGEFVCITGASGSGKSTLMHILAGLDQPDEGSLSVLENDLGTMSRDARADLRLRRIGVVFQDHNLVPDFTAGENIRLLLMAAGHRKDDARELTRQSLAAVGIEELLDRLPREMSGGQMQRVGVARALAGGKQLILADEPTGSLDWDNSQALFEVFAELTRTGVAVVVFTHDLSARNFATRALHMRAGGLEVLA